MSEKTIKFVKSGRGKAQCPPNPLYPHGIAIPCPEVRKTCLVELPYPAPECGMWRVECTCGYTMLITAAGRPDDPVSVEMPCQENLKGECYGTPQRQRTSPESAYRKEIGSKPESNAPSKFGNR